MAIVCFGVCVGHQRQLATTQIIRCNLELQWLLKQQIHHIFSVYGFQYGESDESEINH